MKKRNKVTSLENDYVRENNKYFYNFLFKSCTFHQLFSSSWNICQHPYVLAILNYITLNFFMELIEEEKDLV